MDHSTLPHHFNEHTPLRERCLSDSMSSSSSTGCRPRSQRKERAGDSEGHSLPFVLQLTLGLLGLWSPPVMRRTTMSQKARVQTEQTVVIMSLNDDDLRNQQETTWAENSSVESHDEHDNDCDDDNEGKKRK